MLNTSFAEYLFFFINLFIFLQVPHKFCCAPCPAVRFFSLGGGGHVPPPALWRRRIWSSNILFNHRRFLVNLMRVSKLLTSLLTPVPQTQALITAYRIFIAREYRTYDIYMALLSVFPMFDTAVCIQTVCLSLLHRLARVSERTNVTNARSL